MKAELIEFIAENADLTKADAGRALEAMLEGIVEGLKTKKKVTEHVEKMAKELALLYAQREKMEGFAFGKDENINVRNFARSYFCFLFIVGILLLFILFIF